MASSGIRYLVLTTAKGNIDGTNYHGRRFSAVRIEAVAGLLTTFIGPSDETAFYAMQYRKANRGGVITPAQFETGRNTGANIEGIRELLLLQPAARQVVITSAVHALRVFETIKRAGIMIPVLPAEALLGYRDPGSLERTRENLGDTLIGRRLTKFVDTNRSRLLEGDELGIVQSDLNDFAGDIMTLQMFKKGSPEREIARKELHRKYGGDTVALRMSWEVSGCVDMARGAYKATTN